MKQCLGSLQQAVLEDDPCVLPQTVADGDDSFLIVRAPNVVREVQALCDWIASMIEASAKTNEPLKASDFLVVTPDIDSMAGVIAAVMGARSEEEYLSYHIAGQSELDVNSAARAMLAAMRFVGELPPRRNLSNCWRCLPLPPHVLRVTPTFR